MPAAEVRPAVTAAIVVKDRRELMAECLTALAKQDHPDFEVLVIDNGSADGTFEMLQDAVGWFPVPLRVLQVVAPLGMARQVAAEQARGELIAFTDSDCLPEPEWLTALTAPFAAPGGDDIDVVQGRTRPATDDLESWPRTVSVERWSDLYETCNLAYRRERLLAAGGFPRSCGLYAAEDTTAGWRVRRLGGRHHFAPEALVRHEVSYPGFRWHLDFARKTFRTFPALVAQFPEMRSELLKGRMFLRPRSAAFDAAAVGLALLALRRPSGALLTLPYLRHVARAWSAERTRGVCRVVAYDSVAAAHLVRGSVQSSCLVL